MNGKRGVRLYPRVLAQPLARLLSARLDAELAAGQVPEWSQLHAERADRLVSSDFRAELARNWDHLLGVAMGTEAASVRVRSALRWDRIAKAEPQIRELVDLLRTRQPLPAGGIAAAHLLLIDGTGPIYSPVSTVNLAEEVAEIVARLNT